MTEKIDLRQKGDGTHHPDIAKLIAKCDGIIDRAEKMAGIGQGTFGKIRRGEQAYTDYCKQRVEAALAGQPIPKEKAMPLPASKQVPHELPDTCPPILADLIKHVGSKAKAAKVVGTSEGTLYAVIQGKAMPPAWTTRAKAHMGRPVITAREDDAPPPPLAEGPEFIPWDGKTLKSVSLRSVNGKKPRTIKMPPSFAELIAKHGGNLSQTAAAMGHTSGAITGMINDPKKFVEKWQRKVHAALHGLVLVEQISQDFDRYEMGFAMALVNGQVNIDRVLDVSDILNGKVFYKKNTKSGWWLFIKMAVDDLPRFKKLASRDANEIVCP